jgi:hypothetical protein
MPNSTTVDPIWKPNGIPNGNSIMYDCLFPAMIKSWRRAFKVPDAYFGFVQLASWMQMGGGAHRDPYGNGDRGFALGVAGIRQAQMSATALPRVGYAIYADCGQGALHPTNKWRPGARLGNSALSIQFGKKVPWISPTYESASVASLGDTVSVTVTLGNATALQTTPPFNSRQCSRQMRCVEGQTLPAATTMAKVGTGAACTFKANCDYGKDSRDFAKATTKEQCCSLCEARSGCGAGVFDGTSCWFKTRSVSVLPHVFSGTLELCLFDLVSSLTDTVFID